MIDFSRYDAISEQSPGPVECGLVDIWNLFNVSLCTGADFPFSSLLLSIPSSFMFPPLSFPHLSLSFPPRRPAFLSPSLLLSLSLSLSPFLVLSCFYLTSLTVSVSCPCSYLLTLFLTRFCSFSLLFSLVHVLFPKIKRLPEV